MPRCFKTLFLFVITGFALPAFADGKKHAVLVGGSAEDFNEKNFFQPDFELFSSKLGKRGWNVQILFDGGKSPIRGAKSATNENIVDAIEKVSKEAIQGDQVLFFFHAHGVERKDPAASGLMIIERDPETEKLRKKPGEKSHSVTTENPENFSLDKLQPYTKAMKEKGISVALVDLSCYSGASQSLIADNLCIVSLSASNYVSNCGGFENSHGFTKHFIDLPDDPSVGVNLENQYLAARVQDDGPVNLAAISSVEYPAQGVWEQFLVNSDPSKYKRRERFDGSPDTEGLPYRSQKVEASVYHMARLKKDQKTLDRIDEDRGLQRDPDACFYPRDTIISDLDSMIQKVKQDQQEQLKKSKDQLQTALTEYIKIEQQLNVAAEEVRKLQEGKFDWGVEANEKFGFNKDQADYYSKNASLAMMDTIIKIADSKVPIDSVAWLGPQERKLYSVLIGQIDRIRDRYNSIIALSGDAWKNYEKLEAKLESEAKKIMQLERKFYDSYARSEFKEGNNPCRGFAL